MRPGGGQGGREGGRDIFSQAIVVHYKDLTKEVHLRSGEGTGREGRDVFSQEGVAHYKDLTEEVHLRSRGGQGGRGGMYSVRKVLIITRTSLKRYT